MSNIRAEGMNGYVYYKKETKYWVLAIEYTALFLCLIGIIICVFSGSLGYFFYSLLIFLAPLVLFLGTCWETNHLILPILIIRKLQIRYTHNLVNKTAFDRLVQQCYYYSERIQLEKGIKCAIRFA